MLISFLQKLVEMLISFYQKFDEDVVRDNFVITYELVSSLAASNPR